MTENTTSAQPEQWEYFVTPLLRSSETQILNNWGAQGWELVNVVLVSDGQGAGQVAYMKRKKA